jgi:hypothetical protein
MADQKGSALTELSAPTLDDLLYMVDDPGGTPTSYKLSLTRALGFAALAPGGRLNLSSGVPVTTSDVTGAGTLYYCPFIHDRIRIYDGTRWRYYIFTERTLALSLTSGGVYDVFIYDNSGTLTLETLAWTNTTTRATALTLQDGVLVKTGALTRLFLGTIYASGTNSCDDSLVLRGVWNAYNQVPRPVRKLDATASWTRTGTSWQPLRNQSANKIAVVNGAPAGYNRSSISLLASAVTSGTESGGIVGGGAIGIGVDSTSANSANAMGGIGVAMTTGPTGVTAFGTASSRFDDFVGLGYHEFTVLQSSSTSGTATFYGSGTGDQYVAGMTGTWAS